MIRPYLMLLGCLSLAASELMTVLQTTEDISKFEPSSGAELSNSSLLGQKKVTICARFLTHQLTTHMYDKPFQDLLIMKPLYLLYNEWSPDIKSATYVGSYHSFDIWDLGVWNHVCIMLNAESGILETMINGKKKLSVKGYKPDQSTLSNNLTIMALPFSHGFHRSLFGRMTDVNIWSHSFTNEEARAWTTCKTAEGGDMVNWASAGWRAIGLEEVQVERAEVCKN